MTDLSKELGEIKRRHLKDVADREGTPLNKWQADRAALLHIIEVEIPGILRARADDHSKEVTPLDKANYVIEATWHAGAATGFRDAATLIESLTKKEEG